MFPAEKGKVFFDQTSVWVFAHFQLLRNKYVLEIFFKGDKCVVIIFYKFCKTKIQFDSDTRLADKDDKVYFDKTIEKETY